MLAERVEILVPYTDRPQSSVTKWTYANSNELTIATKVMSHHALALANGVLVDTAHCNSSSGSSDCLLNEEVVFGRLESSDACCKQQASYK
jgi:hypothetical protein